MNPFTQLGYAATNELDPSAWKDYMLRDLDVQDQNMQKQYDYYLKSREIQKKQRKYAQWGDIFGSLGNIGGQFYAKGKAGTPPLDNDWAEAFEETKFDKGRSFADYYGEGG